MRKVISFSLWISFAACGASDPQATSAQENGADLDVSATDSPKETGTEDTRAPVNEQLMGTWQNGSCGDRNYIRRITFEVNGTFTAVDEVAPCPEGAKERCVTSGIIDWKGDWSLENSTIELRASAVENGRLPDFVPQAFIVLTQNPLSIGEQAGGVICPFQKKP